MRSVTFVRVARESAFHTKTTFFHIKTTLNFLYLHEVERAGALCVLGSPKMPGANFDEAPHFF
jgi:hypothetical protein